jgi:hypothetical protein
VAKRNGNGGVKSNEKTEGGMKKSERKMKIKWKIISKYYEIKKKGDFHTPIYTDCGIFFAKNRIKI